MRTEDAVWIELGVPATKDVAVIRKAYADRLKATRPDNDAEGFQRLRHAYEVALRMARDGAATVPRPAAISGESPIKPAALVQPRSETQRSAEAEQVALVAAFRRLQALLTEGTESESGDIEATLEDVLNSPGAYQIATWRGFDQALAALFLNSTPRSDAIAAKAAARLGWTRLEVGVPRPQAVNALLTRLGDIDALAALRRGDGTSQTVAILSKPIPNSRVVRRLYGLVHAPMVKKFLAGPLSERPSMAQLLNGQTIEWWNAYFQKPRLTRAVALFIPVASLYAIVSIGVAARFGEPPLDHATVLFGAAAVFGPLAASVWLFCLVWPRWLVRQRVRERPTRAWRIGWLPASLAVVFLAVLVPDQLTSLVILAAACAGLLVWASASASRETMKLQVSPLRGVMLVSVNSVGVLAWAGLGVALFPPPLAIAVASAILASLIGLWVLVAVWRFDLSTRTRQSSLLALAAASLATVCLLWLGDGRLSSSRLVIALVTTVAVLSRPARWSLQGDAAKHFSVAVVYGAIAAVIVISSSPWTHVSAIRICGTYLAYGVAVIVTVSLIDDVENDRGLLRRRTA